ncbi:hypothetical protein IFM89_012770 [Coptis chinensis]|uniref:Uncharacterized protein n=1 Tax=Coptis chinensis TaxID=261450 RepID=A0A835LL90_9MAGN|nr:hypothetical protein IFM89_012770 [Coptis chinensis]
MVSFVDKVRGAQPQHLDIEDLPVPKIKGNMPSIKLPKKAVERGRLYCRYCLVGRLDMQKIRMDKIRSIAAAKWSPQGSGQGVAETQAQDMGNEIIRAPEAVPPSASA